MKHLFALLFIVAACAIAQTPSKAEAQSCVSAAFNGVNGPLVRRYILLSTQKDSSYATYQKGTLQLVNGGLTSSQKVYFSDHWLLQPFAADETNDRRVTVSSNGTLRVENLTLGNPPDVVSSPICVGNTIVWQTPTRVYMLTPGEVIPL